MRGKQLGPSNIMINFSAAYQFGTRKEVSYPLVKIPNSTTMPVTPPVPVIEIDLTEDESMAPKRQKMVFYLIFLLNIITLNTLMI